jgi:DnaJ-class molecular chaperone
MKKKKTTYRFDIEAMMAERNANELKNMRPCLVCEGIGKVVDQKTNQLRTCVLCNGKKFYNPKRNV